IHVLPESRGGIVGRGGLAGAIHEGGGPVRKHERVLVGIVFKEIEDAFVFEETGDEIEIGLAILDGVLAGLISSAEAVGVVGETAIGEYLLDDVRYRLVLKDTAI